MLNVETGLGLLDSDSYISVLDADIYHTLMGNDAWLDLLDSEKEIALRTATRNLDLLKESLFMSVRMTGAQSLAFPRIAFTARNGVQITGIPSMLKNAVAELALLGMTFDVLAPSDGSGNVQSSEVKIDVLLTKTTYFDRTNESASAMRKINIMLSNLCSGGSSLYAPVVRG